MAYRHSLRVCELVALRSKQIDFNAGLAHIARVKNGTPPMRDLRRDYSDFLIFYRTRRTDGVGNSTTTHSFVTPLELQLCVFDSESAV